MWTNTVHESRTMDRLTCMDAFVRVADAGSFAEAARRWGRSTSVVSKYVGQLEEELGVRLLQRTTRQCTLTEAGARHVERCRDILLAVVEAESQLHTAHHDLRGPLRITAPAGFLTRHRRAVVTTFCERFPGVTLDIDLTHRIVDLVEERFDLAIRLNEPSDSSLVARRLGPAPLVLVAAPAYLHRAGAPDHPRALANHACICDTNFRFHPRWPLLVDGTVVGIDVSGPVAVNSPNFVRDLALDGLGIALVPQMVVEEALAAGTLVEVLPGTVATDWSVWAVTPQRRLLNARTGAFIAHLREAWADEV